MASRLASCCRFAARGLATWLKEGLGFRVRVWGVASWEKGIGTAKALTTPQPEQESLES